MPLESLFQLIQKQRSKPNSQTLKQWLLMPHKRARNIGFMPSPKLIVSKSIAQPHFLQMMCHNSLIFKYASFSSLETYAVFNHDHNKAG